MSTVAIVLSGGFAHGSFEVGAVRYLYDQGIRPNILCGTSVGAVNAAKLAEGEGVAALGLPLAPGQGLPGLEDIWNNLRSNNDIYLPAALLLYVKANASSAYDPIVNFLAPDPDPAPGVTITETSLGGVSIIEKAINAPGLFLTVGWNLLYNVIFAVVAVSDLQNFWNFIQNTKPLSLFDQGPLAALLAARLDLRLVNQWVQAGGRLRFATVGLESGKLRYVTETGQVLERDNASQVATLPTTAADAPACQTQAQNVDAINIQIAALGPQPAAGDPTLANWQARVALLQGELVAAQAALEACRQANPPATVPDLKPAINASAALPVFLEPVVIANQHYVDGGIREVIPVELAARMGATVIYAVNDSPLGGGQPVSNVLEIAQQVATGILPDEVAYRCTTAVASSSAVKVYMIQCTFSGPNDSYAIHPGLIRINISFGYMRAADTVKPVAVRPDRCYQLGEDLTALRRLIFTFEGVAANPDQRLNWVNGPMLRWAKGILSMLINERLNLGGATPADLTGSWTAWEMHRWTPPSATPFDAFVATPAAPAASFVPVNNTVFKDEWPAEVIQPPPRGGPAYVILGGAKFPAAVSDLDALGLGQAPVNKVPVISDANGQNIVSSVDFIPNIPLEGTIIQEVGVNQVYLIQDGAKVALPAGYLASHGISPAAVLTAPHGTLVQIPNAMLIDEDSAIWVIFGHAKFHVPDPGTLNRLYPGEPVTSVFSGCLSGTATVPANGTLLRDDNGAIYVIYGGAQFHVPDMPTLNRLFPNEPVHQLWNGALSGIPTIPVDGRLLRDDNGAIYVIYGGAQFHVPDPAILSRLFPNEPVHQLWNGALSGIPTIPVDGTLLREVTNPQVYLIQGGKKVPAPANTQGTVHTLWDGALAQIPS